MISYLIAHAVWDKKRSESFARLIDSLPHSNLYTVFSKRRDHASVWAQRAWAVVADSASHVVILNDDVIIPENFHEIVTAMVEAVPDQPISLHGTARALQHVSGPWARSYHYTGPGVILTPDMAADLLDYSSSLPWSYVSRVNEDELAAQWAWSRQTPFWVALPSPVAHDVSVPSTLGYDNQPERVAAQPWVDCDETWWKADLDPPFVECSWNPTSRLANVDRILKLGHLCEMCRHQPGVVANPRTEVWICQNCITLSTQALKDQT